MIRVTLAVLLTLASGAHAQVVLYSNANPANPGDLGLATGTTASNGQAAPPGSQWSELQSDAAGCNIVLGLSDHALAAGPYRVADEFAVPAPRGWMLSTANLFAYQPNAPVSLSPFSTITLRVWRGRPGDAGSTIVFGDDATNRLVSATPTELYRIPNAIAQPPGPAPTTERRLWQLGASLAPPGHAALYLAPGTYWLDWQVGSVNADAGAYVPPIARVGVRSIPAANALQFVTLAGAGSPAWTALADPAKPAHAADAPVALPFVLLGDAHCAADIDDGSGTGTPDGGVTIDDLLAYVTFFDAGIILCDLDDGSGTGTPDGGVTIDDLLYFLTRFSIGC